MSSLPTARDLHVDTLLQSFAIGYSNEMTNYVADRATTLKPVQKQSDKYAIWDKGDFFRNAMQQRAHGAKSAGSGQRMSTSTYYCQPYGLHTALDDMTKQNSDVDIVKAKVNYLVGQAKLQREVTFATDLFATGKWTGNTEQTGVSSSPSTNEFLQFNDSSSTPLKKIRAQGNVILASTGRYPNVMVTSQAVMDSLQDHEDFQDLYKHTSGGVPTHDQIAAALGLPAGGIVVGRASRNTAAEGQTATMASIFGKHIVLMYVSPNPTDEEPTAAASFIWTPFDGLTKEGAAISQWYDMDTRSTKYEVNLSYDTKIVAQDCGVMMLSAVA